MGTKPLLQEGDKLLARSPVSLTNTLATTASGGQDYIHNTHRLRRIAKTVKGQL